MARTVFRDGDYAVEGYQEVEIVDNDGFDVIVERVVGRVTFSDNGGFTAYEAALLLIAKEGEPGQYSFPLKDGGTCEVAISHAL